MEEITGKTTKKTNPIERANILSYTFFCWLCPYFIKGYKRDLTEDDMYMHRRQHDSKKLGDRLESAWKLEIDRKDNPSLNRALAKVFLPELMLLNIVPLIAETVRIAQPQLISRLLGLYDNNKLEENINDAYLYAGLIILSALLHMFLNHYMTFKMMQIGMKIRIACCSLVYRKSLRLSKSAFANTTVGQMVNLLSNDVGRFDSATHNIHQLWMGPVETLVVMIFAYSSVGYTGLVGIFFLLLSIPVQSYLGKLTSRFRLQTAIRTDERVRLMNEIISGIQVIKMYTWEIPFAKIVEKIRLREMKVIRNTSIIRAVMMSSSLVCNRIAIFLCIATYVLTGNALTSSYVYTMTSYYRLLHGVTAFFPQAVTQFSESLISIKRIKNFLLSDEVDNISVQKDREITEKFTSKELEYTRKSVGIHLNGVSVKWQKTLQDYNVEDITMNLNSNELAVIIGPVGSGKSTLLNVILKEIPPLQGLVEINGTVSYACQEPWLFGGSIRQNILFGEKYELKKYNEVLRVCALEKDLELFPHGDRTLAGERGLTLSGGQRARINLARAVYKDADIYLLDDPLSAVDAHVGKDIFEKCICEYLRNKCVVLVTHQLQYLKHVENIYLMEAGKVVINGSYEHIKTSKNVFTNLLTEIEQEEEEVRRKSRIVVRSEEEKNDNEIQKIQREERGTGKISWHVYGSYIKNGGNLCAFFFVLFTFTFSQVLDSTTEYFVTFWVNVVQWERQSNNSTDVSNTQDDTFSNWWLLPVFSGDKTIIFYAVLFIMVITFVYTRSLVFYKWCLTASTKMHNLMFDNIVYSPMSFFNANPSGRILNRFSKDIGNLDETLPLTLLDTVQIGLSVTAITLIIGSLSPWILIPTVIVLAIFYVLRIIFLETSRDIKRVESVARSPIYTHLSACLQGLTTIRAFEAQKILTTEFDNYQDAHSAAFFMFLGANRTFGFWLDFICVIYIAFVILTLLFFKSETFGGNIGLALTQAMGLMGMFQFGMRQWSELENQMTSVERIQEYVDLTPEKDNNKKPPQKWPALGQIEFNNMSLQYTSTDPFVLKNLTFCIQTREKVGIVGRTGAGKSSLIQALFRLAHIKGQILIDGVDTETISLNELRSKISIIPQEPILFSGTLRKNLDPFDEHSDDTLWNALEQVELKNAVDDLPAGLDSKMSEGGSNFSVGQRQLVCLARAIIRNNKILVLDEATANVDPHTDDLIQETIRRKFDDCTVLTIAHRLHTIMDSDKVLVMDAGQKVEFDHPHILLRDVNGAFYSLVMQTGKATANNLKFIAENSFHKKRHSADVIEKLTQE